MANTKHLNQKSNISIFNTITSFYDNYHTAHSSFVELISKTCKIDDDSLIVDIGCGTGNETFDIYDNFRCKIYGIDPSEIMLRKAVKKTNEIKWLQGIAEEIPIENNLIDIVTSFFSIHHFYDISQSIKEFNRILKPGGKIFIFTISHDQMKHSLEYQFFPKLLKYDIKRIPSIEFIKNILVKNSFKVEINEVEYETRKIDTNYIEMVKNRYRTGFQKIAEKQILLGIRKIEKAISNNSDIIEKIMCSVLICQK